MYQYFVSHSNFFIPDSLSNLLTSPPSKKFQGNIWYRQKNNFLFECIPWQKLCFSSPPGWDSFCLYHVTTSIKVDDDDFGDDMYWVIFPSSSTSPPSQKQGLWLTFNKVQFQNCNFQYGGLAS